jgi:hypothetical protein
MSVATHFPPDIESLIYTYYNPYVEYFKEVLQQIRIFFRKYWDDYMGNRYLVFYYTTRRIHAPVPCLRVDVWNYMRDPGVSILVMISVRCRIAFVDAVTNGAFRCDTCQQAASFDEFCIRFAYHYCESCDRPNHWTNLNSQKYSGVRNLCWLQSI